MEVFKSIPNFNNYEISDLGTVKNIKTGRILKPILRGKGRYLSVTLCNEEGPKAIFVHKLVATAFCPNPHNKRTVNHIDGNKLNNKSYNLEWLTHAENMEHASRIGLLGQPVRNDHTGEVFNSIAHLAVCLGVTRQAAHAGITKGLKSYAEYSLVPKAA